MHPSHDYVTAARDLFTILKEIGQLDLTRPIPGSTTPTLDSGQALADLNIASRDLADLMHEARHLPDVLIRSQLLFSRVGALKPTVERLTDRAKGRYVVVEVTDRPDLAPLAHQAAAQTLRASELFHAALARVDNLPIRCLPEL
jgi:hypothetical protein